MLLAEWDYVAWTNLVFVKESNQSARDGEFIAGLCQHQMDQAINPPAQPKIQIVDIRQKFPSSYIRNLASSGAWNAIFALKTLGVQHQQINPGRYQSAALNQRRVACWISDGQTDKLPNGCISGLHNPKNSFLAERNNVLFCGANTMHQTLFYLSSKTNSSRHSLLREFGWRGFENVERTASVYK